MPIYLGFIMWFELDKHFLTDFNFEFNNLETNLVRNNQDYSRQWFVRIAVIMPEWRNWQTRQI